MPESSYERQLSSDATAGIQAGLAISLGLITTALGVIAWIPGLDEQVLGRPLPQLIKLFPVFAAVMLLIYFAQASQQCSVYLTAHGLRIVRGKAEIMVPMNQIKTVEREVIRSARGSARTNTVILTFREQTALGFSVRFLAPMLDTQSVVDELRRRSGVLHTE